MAAKKKVMAKKDDGSEGAKVVEVPGKKWRGLEPFAQFLVPMGALNLDPANARDHGDRNVAAVRDSLEDFGQRFPIIVQRQGMIVRAGNGRLLAAQFLGWDHIAAIVVADNRTGELAEWNYGQLGETLTWLAGENYNVERVGFAPVEVEAITLNSRWDGVEDEGVGGGTAPDLGTNIKIRVDDSLDANDVRAKLRRFCVEVFGAGVEVK
jgi:hypothetical protein